MGQFFGIQVIFGACTLFLSYLCISIDLSIATGLPVPRQLAWSLWSLFQECIATWL
ncbi:hypothetical protein BDV40DRAFT_251114, partial [Aspergillus tamarii]